VPRIEGLPERQRPLRDDEQLPLGVAAAVEHEEGTLVLLATPWPAAWQAGQPAADELGGQLGWLLEEGQPPSLAQQVQSVWVAASFLPPDDPQLHVQPPSVEQEDLPPGAAAWTQAVWTASFVQLDEHGLEAQFVGYAVDDELLVQLAAVQGGAWTPPAPQPALDEGLGADLVPPTPPTRVVALFGPVEDQRRETERLAKLRQEAIDKKRDIDLAVAFALLLWD
jgi:hypothetical protein